MRRVETRNRLSIEGMRKGKVEPKEIDPQNKKEVKQKNLGKTKKGQILLRRSLVRAPPSQMKDSAPLPFPQSPHLPSHSKDTDQSPRLHVHKLGIHHVVPDLVSKRRVEIVKVTLGVIISIWFLVHAFFTGLWDTFVGGPALVCSLFFLWWTVYALYHRKNKTVILDLWQIGLLFFVLLVTQLELMIRHSFLVFINMICIGLEVFVAAGAWWGLMYALKYYAFNVKLKGAPLPSTREASESEGE